MVHFLGMWDGARLKQIRKALRVTQAGLAQDSGVTQPEISRLERSDRAKPSLETVRALERGLGIPEGALERDPEPSSSLRKFLASQLAGELNPPLSKDEVTALSLAQWHGGDKEPTIQSWFYLVQALRSLRSKEDGNAVDDGGGDNRGIAR